MLRLIKSGSVLRIYIAVYSTRTDDWAYIRSTFLKVKYPQKHIAKTLKVFKGEVWRK